MKNVLSLLVVAVVCGLLAVAALGPVRNRHAALQSFLSLGSVNPFSGDSQAPARSRAFAGRAQSIWLVCEARGKTDPKLAPTDQPTDAQLDVMRNAMASHHHRVAHALWHAMRGQVSASQAQTITAAYGAGWKSPHQECPLPKATVDASYNPYGEDFLFMHREMVNDVQGALIKENLPCIGAWAGLPGVDDAQWPVPDESTGGVKSPQALATMQAWTRYFNDPKWLRKHSLAQVGFYIEVTVHNNMHMRWATINPPSGFFDGANLPLDNRFPEDWPYDAPTYDWLADPYGSHVNKHFWKLHGLVDQIMDRWLEANGYSTIAEKCAAGDTKCYQWKGTWVGEKAHDRMEADTDGTPSGAQLDFATFTRGELTQKVLDQRADNNDPETYVRRNFCRR